ncbi:uncharacterized protein [Hoplias malabaricus]|uniref:uncharacterized protein n=1 Tax=Hoplias malabaricus TaxID=27720 RepID=UPI003461B4FF
MIEFYALVFLSTTFGETRLPSKIDVPCLNGLKYIQNGDNIHLSCIFHSPHDASLTTWFKQTPGEKPLPIASAFLSTPAAYYNFFDKNDRFNASLDKTHFNLSITNAQPSDSATYYCAVAHYSDIALSDCTVVVVSGRTPVLDSVELGDNTTLQCSVLTDASPGEHSVYWLRHGSGESPPGIIYTHGDTNTQCSRSSEADSPTQSCVYKLPKTNLSLSDAGTYYCAVAVCGQILFGNGTKLDFVGDGGLNLLVLIISIFLTVIVVLFLGQKLLMYQNKDAAGYHSAEVKQAVCDEALHFAAVNYTREPEQKIKYADIHSQVIYYQQNQTL